MADGRRGKILLSRRTVITLGENATGRTEGCTRRLCALDFHCRLLIDVCQSKDAMRVFLLRSMGRGGEMITKRSQPKFAWIVLAAVLVTTICLGAQTTPSDHGATEPVRAAGGGDEPTPRPGSWKLLSLDGFLSSERASGNDRQRAPCAWAPILHKLGQACLGPCGTGLHGMDVPLN